MATAVDFWNEVDRRIAARLGDASGMAGTESADGTSAPPPAAGGLPIHNNAHHEPPLALQSDLESLTFLDLLDTPATYAGSPLFLLRVNAGATAVEFADGSLLYDSAGAADAAVAAHVTALDPHTQYYNETRGDARYSLLGHLQAVTAGGTGLTGIAVDNLIYSSALNTFSATPITAFARALIDDANAAAARTTLELNAGGTGDIWVEKGGDVMTGNLGFNITPLSIIHAKSSRPEIRLTDNTGGVGDYAAISLLSDTDGTQPWTRIRGEFIAAGDADLIFSTSTDGGITLVDRLRIAHDGLITASGNVVVNTHLAVGTTISTVMSIRTAETFIGTNGITGVSSTPTWQLDNNSINVSIALNGTLTVNQGAHAVSDANAAIGVQGRVTVGAGAGSVNGAIGSNYIVVTGGALTSAWGTKIQNHSLTGAGTIAGSVGAALAQQTNGSNNTNLLIGSVSTIPTGNFSIYNSSSYANYFAGNLGIGTTTPTLGRIQVTDTTIGAGIDSRSSFTSGTAIDIYGVKGYATTATTAGAPSAAGIYGQLSYSGSGNISAATGGYFLVSVGGSAPGTANASSLLAQITSSVAASSIAGYKISNGAWGNTGAAGIVLTNAYGVQIGNIANASGTITNTYGVWVGDITAGVQTNQAYSFYASDASARNYLAGDLGIGTPTPGALLDVYSATGGIARLSRNDTSVSANDMIGKAEFWGNDTQLSTQGIFGNIEVQAQAAIASNAAFGKMLLRTTGPGTATSPVERLALGLVKTLTDAATDLFDVTLNAGQMAGGAIHWTIIASDGTDHQSYSGITTYAVVNKAGAYTKQITHNTANDAKAVSSGTLTATWDILDGTNKVTIRVTPTGSLTETTYQILYSIHSNSPQVITVL